MCHCKPAIAAFFTTLALASFVAHASDTAQVPRTAAARAAGDLIAKTERAITGYVAACAARDAKRLTGLTTDDVRIEFTLDEPGTYLTLTSDSVLASCAPGISPAGKGRLWVFPTNDPNAVFVQYDLSVDASRPATRQLALVEMRGDRIARMRNFGPISAATVASTTLLAAATPCAARATD
jgi:hypothetical protein